MSLMWMVINQRSTHLQVISDRERLVMFFFGASQLQRMPIVLYSLQRMNGKAPKENKYTKVDTFTVG